MRYHTRDRVSIGRRIRNAPSPCSLAVPDRTSAVVFTRHRFRLASGKAVGTSPRSQWGKRPPEDWFFQSPVTLTLTFFFTWQPPLSRPSSPLFGVSVVVPALVLGRVVVIFSLVDMPQSTPCTSAVALVSVRFFKINRTTGFLPRSLKIRLLMINQYY